MSVPVILRPIDSKRYILIGDCYLHTMMDGLAIDFQEDRTKELNIRIGKLREEVANLEHKVASPDVSEQDRSDLRQHMQDLDNDSAELASLEWQRFELR